MVNGTSVVLSIFLVLITITIVSGGMEIISPEEQFGVINLESIPAPIGVSGNITDTNASTECNDGEYLDGSSSCINLNDTILFNLTSLGIQPDTNASNCGNGEYLDGSTFCLNFNQTVNDLTKSIYYNATQIITIEGTVDAGDINSIHVPEDGDTYNVSEDMGLTSILIDVNFTDITNFDYIVGRIWYSGGQGHEIDIQLLLPGGTWEQYLALTDTSGWVNLNIPVFDPSQHIVEGNVSVRFDHEQAGISSHDFYIDFLNIVDGWTALTTADHDALSGRDSKFNHPWAFPTDASREINGSVNITGGNLNVSGYNITADHLFGNGSGLNSIPMIVYTNASKCGDGEYLDGSTFCLNFNQTVLANLTSQGIQPDTNASNCGDGEYLDGSGNCLNLNDTILFNVTSSFDFTDTNASTECGDGEYLDGSSACLSFNDTVLLNITSQGIKPDTNFSNCADGEYGDGSNFCINFNATVLANVTSLELGSGGISSDNVSFLNNTQLFTGANTFNDTVILWNGTKLCARGTGDGCMFSPESGQVKFLVSGFSPIMFWGSPTIEYMRASNSGMIFNLGKQANQDSRFLGSIIDYLLFIDVGTNRIGINKSVPSQLLDVNGNVNVDGYLSGSGFSGMKKQFSYNNTDSVYTSTINNRYPLQADDVTNIDYLIYTGSGYTAGSGLTDTQWFVKIINCTGGELESEITGVARGIGQDNWFVRARDTNPQSGCDYAMNFTEITGSGTIGGYSASLEGVLI